LKQKKKFKKKKKKNRKREGVSKKIPCVRTRPPTHFSSKPSLGETNKHDSHKRKSNRVKKKKKRTH